MCPLRLGLWLLFHHLSLTRLNLVQSISHCFSNLPSSVWTLKSVFHEQRCLYSPQKTEFIYKFDEPMLDSIFQVIEQTLKQPWNQRWPVQTITCYVSPGWHFLISNLSLGMDGCSVHWLLLAQSNRAAESVQEKYFAVCFTIVMQKSGSCCLEVKSL